MTEVIDLRDGVAVVPPPPWEQPAPRPSVVPPRIGLRLGVAAGVVAIAYHYSLSTVLRLLGADTPLAYLGLVPVIAVAFAILLARPVAAEPDVHDRYLDWMIGVPAVVLPVVVLVVLPARLSTFFWLWRIDLLTLPVFVCGVVALLFGSRTLFRTKAAWAYLLLVWPVPFQFVLARGLDAFTSWSVHTVALVCRVLPVATPSHVVEGGFRLAGPDGHFELVVASQCSGANGLLGFLLVAAPAAWVARGRRWHKAAWLATGAAVVWLLNVVRILAVFAVGHWWGERTAVDGFHPWVGLVTFSLATAAMVWVLPRFHLRFETRPAHRARGLAERVRAAVPAWRGVGTTLVAVALVAGVLDASLREVNPVASAVGAPQLQPFRTAAGRLDGFRVRPVDQFGWATRFFGEDSDWTRFELAGSGAGGLSSQLPVTADVVTTADVDTFDEFGIEACYAFHGYDTGARREVDLGSGQVGTVLSWQDPRSPIRWTSVYWYWPIDGGGGLTRYQRIVLLLNSSSDGEVTSPVPSSRLVSQLGIAIDERLRGSTGGSVARRDAELRRFLVVLARRLVAASRPRDTP